jgi:hypothetical protein
MLRLGTAWLLATLLSSLAAPIPYPRPNSKTLPNGTCRWQAKETRPRPGSAPGQRGPLSARPLPLFAAWRRVTLLSPPCAIS